MDGTIAAVATAPGRAGVAIVRVSGPLAFEIASCLCGVCAVASYPFARHVRFKFNGGVLDDGVLLLFKAPASYTGEDVAEFQCHGGHVESGRLLSAVIALGARMAEPGEFTRRAFLNGKLDLSEAEAVMDLVNARTERAAIAARAQMDGSLSRKVDEIYGLVVGVTADVEHLLDFDEGDIPEGFAPKAASRAASASKAAKALSDGWRHGEIVRDGAVAVISGAPNAGKSSLMNALLGRSRAIVSDVPGTTRDSIEAELEIDGIPVRLVDTAGIRLSASDAIEAEGIERTGEAVRRADINLRVVDVADGALTPPCDLPVERTLVVLNKCDLVDAVDTAPLAGWNIVKVSAREGRGLDELRAKMSVLIGADDKAVDASSVSLRHRECLDEAREFLDQAVAAFEGGDGDLVVAAGLLRMAAESIGRITGRVWSEDILDAVFSRFCVGK